MLKSQSQPIPKRICNVRWYSTVNMIESLLKIKEQLIETVNRQPDTSQLRWICNVTMWDRLFRSVSIKRPHANCIAVVERKTGTVTEAVGYLLRYAWDLFNKDWRELLNLVAISSFLNYFGPSKLGDEEFGLMLVACAWQSQQVWLHHLCWTRSSIQSHSKYRHLIWLHNRLCWNIPAAWVFPLLYSTRRFV